MTLDEYYLNDQIKEGWEGELYSTSERFENYVHYLSLGRAHGGVVVKALRYKPAGCGFDSRWCHWNFSMT
jgi:hypothetical protein